MDYAKSIAEEYKPWRKGVSWIIVAVQGALAALVGIYFLAAPDSANSTIRFLLAAILVVSSIVDIRAGFSGVRSVMGPQPMAPWLLMRGGAGVALGISYFFAARSEYLTEVNARYLLGFGMIAYAVIGLIGIVAALMAGNFAWAGVLSNILFLAVGAVLIYNKSDSVESNDAVRYLGIAALSGGVGLLVYSYFLKKDQETAAAIEATATIAPVVPSWPADAPSEAPISATSDPTPAVVVPTVPPSAADPPTTLPPVIETEA